METNKLCDGIALKLRTCLPRGKLTVRGVVRPVKFQHQRLLIAMYHSPFVLLGSY